MGAPEQERIDPGRAQRAPAAARPGTGTLAHPLSPLLDELDEAGARRARELDREPRP